MVAHVTAPTAAELDALPQWATLVRAPNPGPMTLDGTNTWVVRAPGHERGVVVDPGPLDEAHLAAVAAHAPIGLILLTHGHPDHADGVARLSELLGGVQVVAKDPRHRVSDGPLADDTPLPSDGLHHGLRDGLRIRVLQTPGHTGDSVCFHITAGDQQAVLSGDTILGRGTTVVAWPDGDLGEYLESLRSLVDLGSIPALPGHGPALADCAAAAGYYLQHRLARLEQVRSAVGTGARDAAEVVRIVYADVDEVLWPAAELSVQAQLAYLERHQ
jgi:glyoxylase-like metal-dependent hydrolase (beta-lactamase superfamily II)